MLIDWSYYIDFDYLSIQLAHLSARVLETLKYNLLVNDCCCFSKHNSMYSLLLYWYDSKEGYRSDLNTFPHGRISRRGRIFESSMSNKSSPAIGLGVIRL
jgi:hypothetical protein